MAETELERAEKRYAQARARLLALKNRAATAARKMDTRRKVILGGALVDLASRDDGAAKLLDRLVRNLPREQDRKAFVGWKPGDALPDGGVPDGGADGLDVPAAGASSGMGSGSAAASAPSARGA